MQLYCKTVAPILGQETVDGKLVTVMGEPALYVVATHADGADTPTSAYGEDVTVLPYSGPLGEGELVGKPVPDGVIDLVAYAAAKRYEVETGGIVVNGAPVATDRGSQTMIANALSYVVNSGAASVSYKSPAGFVTLTAEQIKAVGLAVGAHVQACFKAEDDVDAALHASPPTITTLAQVDAAFAGLGPAS